jgi:hypothetical protein
MEISYASITHLETAISAVFGNQPLHYAHCTALVSSTEHGPMVEMVIAATFLVETLPCVRVRDNLQFVQGDSIFILIFGVAFWYQSLVFLEKAAAKPTKHPHDTQLILGMAVDS